MNQRDGTWFAPAAFSDRPGGTWSIDDAWHLLSRSGFGASAEQCRIAHELGVDEAIESVLDASDRRLSRASSSIVDRLGEKIAAGGRLESLQAWWLMRMIEGADPLGERLALMWHDHFACAHVKVDSTGLMLHQLRTIQTHARGPFHELLGTIARDPAMIRWLDGNRNVNGRPNENWARELFELFALGHGAYTEDDIREAARAFTGWHEAAGTFSFKTHLHDRGSKTVFEKTGPLTGDDVLALTVAQPACATFLAQRFLSTFVTRTPPPGATEELASVCRTHALDTTSIMRTVLRSHVFFGASVRRTQIVSPAEFIVRLISTTDATVPGNTLASACNAMGQRLFDPPTVAGWDGDDAWLDTSTMIARLQFARTLAADFIDHDALLTSAGVRGSDDARRLAVDLTTRSKPERLTAIAALPRSMASTPQRELQDSLSVLLTLPHLHLA